MTSRIEEMAGLKRIYGEQQLEWIQSVMIEDVNWEPEDPSIGYPLRNIFGGIKLVRILLDHDYFMWEAGPLELLAEGKDRVRQLVLGDVKMLKDRLHRWTIDYVRPDGVLYFRLRRRA